MGYNIILKVHISEVFGVERLNLDSIKHESLGRIFDVLARGGSYTRAELAAETELSLMTVGKIAELLTSHGALIQKKQTSESVGRKSAVCSLNPNLFMMVYDLSARPWRLSVIDILSEVRGEYEFDSESMNEISAAAFIEFAGRGGELIGTALLISDAEEGIRERFCQLLGRCPELCEMCDRASAVANAARFDAGISVHIRVGGDGEIGGAIVDGGRLLGGGFGRAGDFRRLKELAGGLSQAIAAVCLTLDPELVRVECADESVCRELRQTLPGELQTLAGRSERSLVIETSAESRSAAIGAALMLRSRWVDSLK